MMLSYALQSVRDRKGEFLGAFVALMCAAALITACGALLETGLRGAIATERYAASPLVVSADQNVHKTTVKHKGNGKTKTKTKHKAKPMAERAWLPAPTVRRVSAVEGVRAAVPELTFPARPVGPDGRFLPAADGRTYYGHSWASAALTPFTLTRGDAPKAATDLVVDREFAARADLAPGDRLTVQSTGSPRTYRITGIAAPEPAADRSGDLRHQTSLFFSTAEAERLAVHPGQVTAIGVLPENGTDIAQLKKDVTQALAGSLDGTPAGARTALVSSGDDRGPVEFLDAAGARIKLVSMGGAIGGTSLLVGASAGLVGSLVGLPLGAWLHGRFVELGAVPATLERTASVFPMFAAIGATLLGAWAAARISGRRIARIRPAEAMAEAAVDAMGLVLAFTAIAVVNTLAMSVSERIREFAMLRLAGATRRQVLRMLRTEALTVLLIGAFLGTGIALAVLTAFSVGMTGNAAPAVQPLVYATVVCAAGLLALVATALPGRAALKARPVEVAMATQ
ncbi:ABC transporter permease [Streptomyces sp. 21So2-11]|uniref:ABC transporter permease n=1 Tax=Streptomyces sp. 21So2-11 TaxID=3144408 RepID=UPI00321AFA84